MFQFKLPPPEEDENGDIIPLTKAEIKELQETQSEEEKARLSELSASTSLKCENIKNICEENNIEIAATIMANVSKNLIMNRLIAKIQIFLKRISSIFAATHIPNEDEDPSHDVSTKLYNGCLTLSRFGPYCPVALLAPDKKRIKSTEYPVIYKSHVYLCGSEELRLHFPTVQLHI